MGLATGGAVPALAHDDDNGHRDPLDRLAREVAREIKHVLDHAERSLDRVDRQNTPHHARNRDAELREVAEHVVREIKRVEEEITREIRKLARKTGRTEEDLRADLAVRVRLLAGEAVEVRLIALLERLRGFLGTTTGRTREAIERAIARIVQTSRVFDRTPPVIANLVPAPDSILAEPRPAISASFSDALSGVDAASARVRLDGQDLTALATILASGLSVTPPVDLVDGPHTASVEVSDLGGNRAMVSWSFTTDATAPEIAVADPQDGTIVQTATPPMRVTYADATSGVDLTSLVILLDGMDITPRFEKTATEATFTPQIADALADGPHTLQARILDRAGNEGAALSAFTVVTSEPDTTPPEVEIVFPRPSAAAPQVQAFEGTDWEFIVGAKDPGPNASGIREVRFLVDGAQVAIDTEAPFRTSVSFPEGIVGQTRTLTALAVDVAGNQAISDSVVVTFVMRPATGAIAFRASGAPATIQAGELFPGPVTIEAVDAGGNVDPDYVGTILFFTSDSRSFLRFFRTATFAAADAGVIQVDLNALAFGQPPLLTAGTQVIAMADLSNPARDQGVMLVDVLPGPPALLDFSPQTRSVMPSGGKVFPVEVLLTDAFGNSIPGIEVRLEVFEDGTLTQTLTATTFNPALFGARIGSATNRVVFRTGVSSVPALGERELQRLVDATLTLEGLPSVVRAGDDVTIRFAVLDRDGEPVPQVRVHILGEHGFTGDLVISEPTEFTSFLQTANRFSRIRLTATEGPLTSEMETYVQHGTPVLEEDRFGVEGPATLAEFLAGVEDVIRLTATDQFGNFTFYEQVRVTLTLNGRVTTGVYSFGKLSGGVLRIALDPELTFDGAVLSASEGGLATITVELLSTGQRITAEREILPTPSRILGKIGVHRGGAVAPLPEVRLASSQFVLGRVAHIGCQQVPGGASTGPQVVFTTVPTVISEGGAQAESVVLSGDGKTVQIVLPAGASQFPTALRVSGMMVQTLGPEQGPSVRSRLVLAGPVSALGPVGFVINPVVRFVSESFIIRGSAGADLDGLVSPAFVFMADPTIPHAAVQVVGRIGGGRPPDGVVIVAVADGQVFPESIEATLESVDAGGDPVEGGEIPGLRRIALLRIADTAYASRPITVVDPTRRPLAGLTPTDPVDEGMIAGLPGGTVRVSVPATLPPSAPPLTDSLGILGFDGDVKVTVGAGEPPVPGENGFRHLDFSIFRDRTPELRFRLEIPGFETRAVYNPLFPIFDFEAEIQFEVRRSGEAFAVATGNLWGLTANGRPLFPEVEDGAVVVRFGPGTLNEEPLVVGVNEFDLAVEMFSPQDLLPLWGLVTQKFRTLAYAEDALDPQSGETVVEGGWTQETFDSRDTISPVTADNEFGVEEEQFVLDSRLRMFFKADDPETPANEGLTDARISDLLALNRFAPHGLDRDRGLVSVRASRRIAGQELIDLRDSPPNQPDVDRAQFVHSLEFVRPRFNGDGVQVFNPAQQPVVDSMDVVVPVDNAVVSEAIRRDEQGGSAGQIVHLNPYRLQVVMPSLPDDGVVDAFNATFIRNADGAEVSLHMTETASDSNAFTGADAGVSATLTLRLGEGAGSGTQDGIAVDVESVAFGIPFEGTKLLGETGLDTRVFRETGVQVEVTVLGQIGPATVDAIQVRLRTFDGRENAQVLTETAVGSQVFVGPTESATVFDVAGQPSLASPVVVGGPGGHVLFSMVVTDDVLGIPAEPVGVQETAPGSLVFTNDRQEDATVLEAPEAGEVPALDLLQENIREAQQFLVRVVEPAGSLSGITMESVDDAGDVSAQRFIPVRSIGGVYFESSRPLLALAEDPDAEFSQAFSSDFLFVRDANLRARKGSVERVRREARIVALGDSLTAGMNSGNLRSRFQRLAYPGLLGYRMGPRLGFPDYPGTGRPSPIFNVGIETFLSDIAVLPPPATSIRNPGGTYQNMGTPGARLRDFLAVNPTFPSAADTPTGDFQVFFDDILAGARTGVQKAADQKSVLATVFLGNNDTLLSIINGERAEFLTSAASFRTDFRTLLDGLRAAQPSPDIVVYKLPDTSGIPILRPVGQPIGKVFPFTVNATAHGFIGIRLTEFLANSRATIVGQPSPPAGTKVSFLAFGDLLTELLVDAFETKTLNAVIGAGGMDVPLAADASVAPDFLVQVRTRVQEFNQAIEEVVNDINTNVIATQAPPGNPILVVDTQALFDSFAAPGTEEENCITRRPGVRLGSGDAERVVNNFWCGGLFSLDGVHPSVTGQAILADALIERVQQAIDPDSPQLPKIPRGATHFSGTPLRRWMRSAYTDADFNNILGQDPRNRR
ncbi:MAG: hypothetical protein HY608_01755 [Planctomycetes bacterium]|nr:hypothetical protein [Planctomycetota bacterium]